MTLQTGTSVPAGDRRVGEGIRPQPSRARRAAPVFVRIPRIDVQRIPSPPRMPAAEQVSKDPELLEARGAHIDFFDPFVPEIPPTREHAALTGRKSEPWSGALAGRYDAVLVATDHDGVDYAALVESAALVVDTRNVCRRAGIQSPKVVPA